MDQALVEILEKIRQLSVETGMTHYSIPKISRRLQIPEKTILQLVSNEEDLVDKALEYERDCFREIFERHNFDGVNSINIMLIVSREISRRFYDISPSVTLHLKKYYPAIYQSHIEKRIEFIFEMMRLNIQKGIRQEVYRGDVSTELVARLYISRLIDLHNPDFFPPDKFSFETLFNTMFDHFIRGIATTEGLKYYEEKKSEFGL